MQEDAVKIVKAFFAADKPVAAICHGPWLLAEADVVKGRTLTSWPSIRTDLRNAGATVVDEEVHVDGKLITSRKPDDIPAFNKALLAKRSGPAERRGERIVTESKAGGASCRLPEGRRTPVPLRRPNIGVEPDLCGDQHEHERLEGDADEHRAEQVDKLRVLERSGER